MQNRKTIQNAYTEKFSEPNARNDGISETSSFPRCNTKAINVRLTKATETEAKAYTPGVLLNISIMSPIKKENVIVQLGDSVVGNFKMKYRNRNGVA